MVIRRENNHDRQSRSSVRLEDLLRSILALLLFEMIKGGLKFKSRGKSKKQKPIRSGGTSTWELKSQTMRLEKRRKVVEEKQVIVHIRYLEEKKS